MNASEFTKTVFGLVQERLVTIGFRKRKQGISSLPASEDVLGLVGLNKALARGLGILEINPVVGVRNQRVEKLVAKLLGEPFNELNPFSAGANIGYLSPQSRYQRFIFAKSAPLDGPADELVATIRTDGLPFIYSNVSLPALLKTMRSTRFAVNLVAVYRIPVLLHLLGNRDQVESFLSDELTKLGARTDSAAERYRFFATRMKECNRSSLSALYS